MTFFGRAVRGDLIAACPSSMESMPRTDSSASAQQERSLPLLPCCPDAVAHQGMAIKTTKGPLCLYCLNEALSDVSSSPTHDTLEVARCAVQLVAAVAVQHPDLLQRAHVRGRLAARVAIQAMFHSSEACVELASVVFPRAEASSFFSVWCGQELTTLFCSSEYDGTNSSSLPHLRACETLCEIIAAVTADRLCRILFAAPDEEHSSDSCGHKIVHRLLTLHPSLCDDGHWVAASNALSALQSMLRSGCVPWGPLADAVPDSVSRIALWRRCGPTVAQHAPRCVDAADVLCVLNRDDIARLVTYTAQSANRLNAAKMHLGPCSDVVEVDDVITQSIGLLELFLRMVEVDEESSAITAAWMVVNYHDPRTPRDTATSVARHLAPLLLVPKQSRVVSVCLELLATTCREVEEVVCSEVGAFALNALVAEASQCSTADDVHYLERLHLLASANARSEMSSTSPSWLKAMVSVANLAQGRCLSDLFCAVLESVAEAVECHGTDAVDQLALADVWTQLLGFWRIPSVNRSEERVAWLSIIRPFEAIFDAAHGCAAQLPTSCLTATLHEVLDTFVAIRTLDGAEVDKHTEACLARLLSLATCIVSCPVSPSVLRTTLHAFVEADLLPWYSAVCGNLATCDAHHSFIDCLAQVMAFPDAQNQRLRRPWFSAAVPSGEPIFIEVMGVMTWQTPATVQRCADLLGALCDGSGSGTSVALVDFYSSLLPSLAGPLTGRRAYIAFAASCLAQVERVETLLQIWVAAAECGALTSMAAASEVEPVLLARALVVAAERGTLVSWSPEAIVVASLVLHTLTTAISTVPDNDDVSIALRCLSWAISEEEHAFINAFRTWLGKVDAAIDRPPLEEEMIATASWVCDVAAASAPKIVLILLVGLMPSATLPPHDATTLGPYDPSVQHGHTIVDGGIPLVQVAGDLAARSPLHFEAFVAHLGASLVASCMTSLILDGDTTTSCCSWCAYTVMDELLTRYRTAALPPIGTVVIRMIISSGGIGCGGPVAPIGGDEARRLALVRCLGELVLRMITVGDSGVDTLGAHAGLLWKLLVPLPQWAAQLTDLAAHEDELEGDPALTQYVRCVEISLRCGLALLRSYPRDCLSYHSSVSLAEVLDSFVRFIGSAHHAAAEFDDALVALLELHDAVLPAAHPNMGICTFVALRSTILPRSAHHCSTHVMRVAGCLDDHSWTPTHAATHILASSGIYSSDTTSTHSSKSTALWSLRLARWKWTP